MAFIKESVSFLSVPNKSIFKDVIVLNHPPNFQTAPASSLIHKNGNPLSIYHHSVNTMNKEFQNDGDRLKEELMKSIGRERIILLLQFSNHQYFLSHYRS